jgi:hypothetical protein
MRTLLPVALVLSLAPAPRTQVGQGEVGFEVISNGVSYGTLCGRSFSCAYLPADLHRGRNADLVVRGVHNQWYVIALWFDVTHQCLAVPGFHNQLFSPVFFEPFFGILTQRDTIRVCPGGIERRTVAVPAGLPVGAAVTLQALAYSFLNGAQVPTFTPALRATIR